MPPKPLSHAPRNPQRRSKEERQALDQAETERRQARNAAAEAGTRRTYPGPNTSVEERWGNSAAGRGHGLGGSLRYVRGGRGGFMGQRDQQPAQPPTRKPRATATAPSSSSNPTKTEAPTNADVSANADSTPKVPGRSQRRRGDAATTASESRQKIKADPDARPETSEPSAESAAKGEQIHGINPSDDEAQLGQNVAYINLLSDSDNDEDTPMQGTAARGASHRYTDVLQPLRILRKPHKDRSLQFSLPVPSGSSGHRREPRDRSRVETHPSAAGNSSTSIPRTFDDDVETNVRSKRGAVPGQEQSHVKQEPTSTSFRRRTRASASRLDLESEESEDEEVNELAAEREAVVLEESEHSDEDTKEAAASKIRAQRKASRINARRWTGLSEEERLEQEKQEKDLGVIQQELGDVQVNVIDPKTDPTGTVSERAARATTVEDGVETDRKAGAVYLFQLPPIVPDLTEPSSSVVEPASPQASKKSQAGNHPTEPIKIEDADGVDGAHALSNAPRHAPYLAAGLAGQLQVHKSGRATLNWGGISMEVSLGISPYFLQTVVLADTNDAEIAADAEAEAAHGNREQPMGVDHSNRRPEAVSFGQIRGKFIVTPDWREILR